MQAAMNLVVCNIGAARDGKFGIMTTLCICVQILTTNCTEPLLLSLPNHSNNFMSFLHTDMP